MKNNCLFDEILDCIESIVKELNESTDVKDMIDGIHEYCEIARIKIELIESHMQDIRYSSEKIYNK